MGPLLGPHARTNRTRGIRVAQPRLPAPEYGQPGEGRRLTPDAPHRAYKPRGHCWAPYPHTRANSTWTAGPGSPQEEGTRRRESTQPRTPLTTVAGHQGTAAPHHPRSTQPPHGLQANRTVLGPRTRTTAPTAQRRTPTARPKDRQSGGGAPDLRRPSGRRTVPPPPGMPFRHPQSTQRRPPRPHQPHSGHTGRGTPAARPRGRAAGGGTAPDTRRPSQGIQATGTVLGPIPAHSCQQHVDSWPWQPPGGGKPGEGERLASDAPRNGVTTDSGGRAPNAHTHTQTPARRTSVQALQPTPRSAHSTYTSHGKSACHPLLLGTATQQWRNPRPHAKHAPNLRRWTWQTRSSGRWDSEAAKETPHEGTRARTPTWKRIPEPCTGSTFAGPAPLAGSVPTICPAWKRGHCTG